MDLFLSRLKFFFRSSPDGGRDIPFSFMLTVSSFLEIQPPILCCRRAEGLSNYRSRFIEIYKSTDWIGLKKILLLSVRGT